MKNSFYCEACHSIYDVGEWATQYEDKAVCAQCGGELAQLDKAGHSGEGGES
jgi:rRNA maturation endonuclease Nob1